MYATLPPFLKFTVIDAELLSEVRTRSLSISSVLELAISKDADAVDAICNPLIDVAVAAPRVGADKVGDVRVLFVRTCVSFSVTISAQLIRQKISNIHQNYTIVVACMKLQIH